VPIGSAIEAVRGWVVVEVPNAFDNIPGVDPNNPG
jgi:hypothetical protein